MTHDQTEAFAVSDEVIVMNKGKIMQKAPAKELYCVQFFIPCKLHGRIEPSLKVNWENNTIDVNGYKIAIKVMRRNLIYRMANV